MHNITFKINKLEKVAFIGHNGIGKSTLLKILMKQLKSDTGEFEWGHNANIAYLAQDHHEELNKKCSVLEWLTEHAPTESDSNIRRTLGNVLFKKDDVHKNVLNLSGGECARLLLAKSILQKPNILILDEPTNHLDIETIDALSKALQSYNGTLLLVTHNRSFLSEVADRIIALTEKGLTNFNGRYQEFINKFGEDYLQRKLAR